MPETILATCFNVGLRDDARMQNNTEHLVRCYGMRATEHGLVASPVIADGTDGATVAWPFPQMFKGEGFTLCLKADVLQYEKADGTLQTLPVFEPAVSGSELMADTDMSSWNDTSPQWTIAGTVASKIAGSAGEVTDLLGAALTAERLYRFTVNVSAVATSAASEDKMYVRIGGNSSERQVPRVGLMEFDVYTATNNDLDLVSVFGEENAAFTVTGTSLKLIAAVTNLGLGSTSKPFHMVSFGKIWFLVGDTMTLLCAPMCGTKGAYTADADYVFNWRVVRWNGTKLRAMAAFNERLYVSGFDATDSRYDSNQFAQALDVFTKSHMGAMYENFEVAKNVVFYGSFLGGDINWPFAADLALFGLLDSAQATDFSEVYVAALREGNQGFLLLPLQGRVLRMERLAESLVCYCEDGVVLLQPSSENGNLHRVRILSHRGLADKGLLAMTDSFHMYVDTGGKLQFVSNEYTIRELGYEEFLGALVTGKASAPPVGVFDVSESEAYFSNGAVSYVRSRSGLGEVWTAVTSLYQHPTTGVTGSRLSIAPGNGKVRVKTGAIDFGNRVFKFIHDLEIGAYDVTNLMVRVHYKNNHSTNWQAGEWHEVIRGGFTLPLTSGYEFAFELEFTPGASARIEYIKCNWQIRDNRNFRRQAGRI
jgi:hypothetical protein